MIINPRDNIVPSFINLHMRCLLFSVLVLVGFQCFAQGLKLKECVVIAQFEKLEDRYALEVNLCEILNPMKVQTIPATNIVKQGGTALQLSSDSSMMSWKAKNIQTYCVVSVKGYDKKFKSSKSDISFKDALERATLYSLYKADISSVTFEFLFFREGKVVYSDLLKIGNIGERDDVVKRFRKKAPKHIAEHWLN
jgi:hypothetical protein